MSMSALVFLMLQGVPAGGTHHAGSAPFHAAPSVAWDNEVNFFQLYDRNRNDMVDRRELESVAVRADRNLARRTPAEKGRLYAAMTEAFATLDRNGDGRVSRQEFQQANMRS